MRLTLLDMLRAMFGVAFLTACVASQWRGDDQAPLRLALVIGIFGIPAAAVRYLREKSPRYLMAMGILGFLYVASCLMMFADWP